MDCKKGVCVSGPSLVLVGRGIFEDGIFLSTSRPRAEAEINQTAEACLDAPVRSSMVPRVGRNYLDYLDEKALVEVAGQEFFLRAGQIVAALEELLLAVRGVTLEVR